MRSYELMCVFSAKGDFYTEGVKSVENILKNLGTSLEKSEDFGHRALSYMLNRETYGRYYLYVFKDDGEIFDKLNGQLSLQVGLLRYLLVLQKKPCRSRLRKIRQSSSEVESSPPVQVESSPPVQVESSPPVQVESSLPVQVESLNVDGVTSCSSTSLN